MDPRQVFSSYDAARTPSAGGYTYCPVCGAHLSGASQAGIERSVCPACGWIHYRNPMPGVVALVERDGKVLLGRRGQGSFRPGTWCLPGGFMEWAEDFLSAGRREVREETGLEIQVRSILSVVTNHLSPDLHTLVVVLLAVPTGGIERPGDDLVELKWFALGADLPDLAFGADGHIVARYAERAFPGAPVDPRYRG